MSCKKKLIWMYIKYGTLMPSFAPWTTPPTTSRWDGRVHRFDIGSNRVRRYQWRDVTKITWDTPFYIEGYNLIARQYSRIDGKKRCSLQRYGHESVAARLANTYKKWSASRWWMTRKGGEWMKCFAKEPPRMPYPKILLGVVMSSASAFRLTFS